MCYKGKCLMCIPVEHGCLVLAILSAIGTGLSLLSSVTNGVLLVVGHFNYTYYHPESDPSFIFNEIAIEFFILVTGVASLVAFIFSVQLCNGICKIVTGLTLLASVLSVLPLAGGYYLRSYPVSLGNWVSIALKEIAVAIFILIIAVASLVAFIFSVLLCNGICKRRPGQVKAYFSYGVVITVLAVLSAFGYLISNSREPEPGIITLFACVIYSLFLVLVHQTHAKLQKVARDVEGPHPSK